MKGGCIMRIIIIMLLVCLSGSAFSQSYEDHRLIINGVVELAVPPDHASFSFGVSVTESKLSDAVRKTKEKVNIITDSLRKNGLSNDNIRTSYFQSGAKYNNEGGSYYGGKGYEKKLIGYQASISVQVDLDSLEWLESIATKVSEFEPNSLSNIRFSLKNYEKAKKDALRLAFVQAKEKALILAEEGGCDLGNVIEIDGTSSRSIYYGTPTPFNASYSVERDQIEVDSGSPGTFFPGDIKISASVKVTFEIKKRS